MRPDGECRRDCVERPAPAAPSLDDANAADGSDRAEQRLELVATRLLAVPHEDRSKRRKKRRDEAGPPIIDLDTEPVDRSDQKYPGDDRRCAHRQIAIPDRAPYRPEQNVVKRRMAVGMGEVLDQLGEPELCLLDADRLVEPQAARYRDADGEPGDHESAEPGRGRSGRDRGPSGQPRTASDRERALGTRVRAPRPAQTSSCASCSRAHCLPPALVRESSYAAAWYGARDPVPVHGARNSRRCPARGGALTRFAKQRPGKLG